MARILVVDDENNIRMMVRLTLQHDGHTVETAADGNEGLEKFGDGAAWDVTLLDQRMPGMEGLTVLQEMRYVNPNARIIMATAFGTVDLAVDAMKAGATDFLRKPFTAETLRGAVQAALTNAAVAPKPSGQSAEMPAVSGITFGMTTINGFHIAFQMENGIESQGARAFSFTVRSPDGEARPCTVILAPGVVAAVQAHVGSETVLGGVRFWQALCEETLANYVYQNAALPPEGVVRIEEFTTGVRRFVDAMMRAR